MYPYNYFRSLNRFIDLTKVFVAMPFADEFDNVYTSLIIPSIDKVNEDRIKQEKLKPYRGKDPKNTRVGWLEILENLFTSRIVIGVLTGDNPNVFYELGIAHSTQQIERQLLIAENGYKPKFDLKDLIFINYDSDILQNSIPDLVSSIKDTLLLFDKKNDLQVMMAQSKLGHYEFEMLQRFGRNSHFYLPERSPQNFYDGLSYLCHSGLIRLSTRTIRKEPSLSIEYSYYWTDLGNSVLHNLDIIAHDELEKRIKEYHKFFNF